MMADTDRYAATWGDSAINAFVNLTPSSPWAMRVAEQWKGLPFGKYLQQAPRKRTRAVTGPPEPPQGSLWQRLQLFSGEDEPTEQSTYEQPASSFLTKLPLDVRMIIYEMVLGSMVFHIESGTPQSRIYHLICTLPDKIGEPNHQCHEITKRPSSAPREDFQEASGLLPLLVTCRKVYTESIHILYSSNTFQFTSNHGAFRFLKVMIPPHRIQSIRHFRMTMRVPHHPHMNARSKRDWAALWDFFTSEMTGLQSLFLKFLMLHDTQEEIRKTEDADALAWVQPMVNAAVTVNRSRGCKVEIATGKELQDLSKIFKETARENDDDAYENVLQLACTEVHKRIRLSLGGQG